MQVSFEVSGQDTCPVAEAFFARLINTPCDASVEATRHLPEDTRARLAVFCYRRAHLRRLGLVLARTCSKQALARESGHAGELIYQQAQNLEATLSGDRYLASHHHQRRKISLAN